MNKIGINNLAPKIISILFALIMWIYVMSAINPRVSRDMINIPVSLVNIEELKDQKLVLVGDQDFRVRVRLTGRRDEVYKVSADQIQVKADLRGYRLGTNNIPLEIFVPNSNIDVDISPKFIRVELEEVIRKSRDVKVLVTGNPKQNYVIGKPEYKPTVVWIEGPESYVNSVESVVANLDVTGESKQLALSLPLKPVNSRGEEVKNVDVKTSYVDVSLDIDLIKSVPIKLNEQITAAEGYSITNVDLNKNEILLRGEDELLGGITQIETELVELQNLTKNEKIEVNLKLPQGIELYEEEPILVDINVEKIEEKAIKIDKDKIIFKNLGENLRIDKGGIPESLDVIIVGLTNILDNIKEDDISIEVDLSELSADEYTIEPIVQIPFIIEKDVEQIYLNPKSINIKLIKD